MRIAMETVFYDPMFQTLIDTLHNSKVNGDFESMREYATILEEKSKLMGNSYSEVLAYYFHATCKLAYNNVMETLRYCLMGKELSKEKEYYDIYIRLCMVEATAYIYLNERTSAIEFLLDGYHLSLKYNYMGLHAQILNNIGSVFFDLGKYDISLEYYLKSYQVEVEHEVNRGSLAQAILNINIVNAYVRLKKYNKALEWEKAHLLKEDVRKIPLVYYTLLGNHVLIELGSNTKETLQPDTKENIEERVKEILNYLGKMPLDSYFAGFIFEIIEVCFSIEYYSLAKVIIEQTEDALNQFKGYEFKERLINYKIRLWEVLEERQALCESLLAFRQVVYDGKKAKLKNESIGILSKIHLKEMEDERRQMEKKNEELREKNKLDSFTGVYNKVAFEQKVKECLEADKDNVLQDALIIIDIDNFKSINDVYGHAVGDVVIKQFAQLLKDTIRNTDFIGRIGGDEFSVVMTKLFSKESVENWCRYFMKGLNNLRFEELEKISITASIGITLMNHDDDYIAVFEKADKAMYQSKKAGKNSYAIYGEETVFTAN